MSGDAYSSTYISIPRQNKVDLNTIVEVIPNHTRRHIDLIGLITTMKRSGLIMGEKYSYLMGKYMYTGFCEFVMEVLSFLSFELFCYLLEEVGYKDISAELRYKRFTLVYKRPSRIVMPHSRNTHAFYRIMKSCIDNDSFIADTRLLLRDIILKQDKKIVSTESIPSHERQIAMEKKAAAVVLLMQHLKNYEERNTILQQVIRTETNGIDNASLNIIYNSKMAITEAQQGNVSKAEEYVVQTKVLCESYGPCFAVTSALHDIEYTYKTIYNMDQTQTLLERVFTEGDIALQSLHEEKADVQNLWQRIMLLFMVMSLLFITSDFVVCHTNQITAVNKKRAEQLIKEVKRRSGDIEVRRHMILCFCLGVLNEHDDLVCAEVYVRQALKAADGGGCFCDVEKLNIETYLNKIRNKLMLCTQQNS